jgi:redox-sensitive bicupin YhaK (pirin superfamily)
MKKLIPISWGGRNERDGDWLINRLLPNEQAPTIGSFVYLGHLYPIGRYFAKRIPSAGSNAHPHRGIVTLHYLLDGSLKHRDSRNHRAIANRGDVLWLKAGNGIIHEEIAQFCSSGERLHSVQFWVNLPAVNKMEDPEFRLLRSRDIPELELPDNGGLLRVILGRCGSTESPLVTYQDEFIFHVHLHPKSKFVYSLNRQLEYGVFIPCHEVQVNGESACNSHLLGFLDGAEEIRLHNPGISGADIILFGGLTYKEPYVAEGPFVMNSRTEIARAYREFFEGRYGELPIDSET